MPLLGDNVANMDELVGAARYEAALLNSDQGFCLTLCPLLLS